MKKTIKRIIASLLATGVLMLSGCYAESADQVKIATEKEIVNYAKEKYGAASSCEVLEEENRRTVTFTDSEYGFAYTVASCAIGVGLDSATLGYEEEKQSDFSENYYRTLFNLVKEKYGTQYDVDYGNCSDTYFNCIVSCDEKDAEKVTGEIGTYFKKLDTRKFYSSSDSCIKAYDAAKENYIGSWHLCDGKYCYYADELVESMTITANAYINRVGDEEKEIRYLYWEQMDISEVPGIEKWELVNHTIDDGTTVTLYWFEIENEKHFFADIEVWNIGNVTYSDTLEDMRNR